MKITITLIIINLQENNYKINNKRSNNKTNKNNSNYDKITDANNDKNNNIITTAARTITTKMLTQGSRMSRVATGSGLPTMSFARIEPFDLGHKGDDE